ncbi:MULTISPECIES: MsnO8 family LLM class oxidoreductase [Tatumella]|uniref:MsnO8 family LLM class oxidoreductase n=1 Tax=Tatumella punctata TaxID=399969 RepID=A0ABW1VNL5_9GAMM|nr:MULTISPECIES: MsnO8 family LLM class oxidoreductase [unclassified Tatumella]MBS0856295.1 MsnO8 family LLM class oxidoreductase [Tatumella sp. JGM16]MBS0876356.1 MsnO8 family LLM class oxidoreductase [Tatumella sp. JGM82]MBS0889529.1 MsnO8 family LLM class oxidoreductase [Tatumella sp. JGM94]MBS0900651.1 MsnO8 family LLM class oxidoreductase [Tatumella sp. JGM100]MBS0913396.1 MsnO8 family LLM class oxidoreductase [Tatumella sp. JGM91]
MPYQLSVLDKCLVPDNETATGALNNVAELARLAENWGYHRFWLAEHHNTSSLASPSPEIVIAWILSRTRKIRVGSGGVMLQHYSPYKVAENFNLLSALAPGRVDLGVGKAPGGLPLATGALQEGRDSANAADFSTRLKQLDDYLQTREAADPENALLATPIPAVSARRFLLGASTASASLAAELGWDFVFAAHLNGDRQLLNTFTRYWQKHSQRPVRVAIQAIVSEDPDVAMRQAAEQQLWQAELVNGQRVTLASQAQAERFIRQSGSEAKSVTRRQAAIFAGSAQSVIGQLDALHRDTGISEFIIDIPVSDPAVRRETLYLLAQAKGNIQPQKVPAENIIRTA